MATNRTDRRPSARPLAAALLALTVCALAGPPAAWAAACGGHVAERADVGLNDLAVLGGAERRTDAPADLPCNGPSCSKRPTVPAAPAHADPARARTDRWAATVDPAAPPPLNGSPLAAETGHPRAVLRPETIDRPPR